MAMSVSGYTSKVSLGSMLSKKDFEGGLCAILIQEKYTTENIDSRNRRLGVKDCTLTEGRRLFRQHRSKREAASLMSASSATSGHWVANASAPCANWRPEQAQQCAWTRLQLLDHLVGAGEQRRRNVEAQRLRGL
jgi:hypothetical protein